MRDIDSEKEERILTFMESLAAGNTAFLNSLEKEALGEAVALYSNRERRYGGRDVLSDAAAAKTAAI